MKKIRIGYPSYINCLPVYYGLSQSEKGSNYELVKGTPSELNALMRKGKLHVSAVSSIEYARNQEKYLLLPELCLNSRIKVMSVCLFSKYPLEELHDTHIGLTDTSATSHVLLKIILKQFCGYNNTFTVMQPDLNAMLEEFDAALLIGDDALKNRYRKNIYIYDLAELWHNATQKEFVFALWVMDREWASQNIEYASYILPWLKDSLFTGFYNLEEIIKEAERQVSGINFTEYFKHVQYDFTYSCKKGLELFYRYARQSGHIQDKVKLNYLTPRVLLQEEMSAV